MDFDIGKRSEGMADHKVFWVTRSFMPEKRSDSQHPQGSYFGCMLSHTAYKDRMIRTEARITTGMWNGNWRAPPKSLNESVCVAKNEQHQAWSGMVMALLA